MAWVIDPNFGNTLGVVDAFAPFPTGGGNKVLSTAAAGAVYRDDPSLNLYNLDISCDLLNKTFGQDGETNVGLIARRQTNGSFYVGSYASGSNTNINLDIFRYNGISDTFSTIASANTSPILGVPLNTILRLIFRLQNDSLSLTLLNGATQLIQVGITNSVINTSGQPGLGSNFIGVGSSTPQSFIDNFTVKQIT